MKIKWSSILLLTAVGFCAGPRTAAAQWLKDPALSHDVRTEGWRKLSCHVDSWDLERQQLSVYDQEGNLASVAIGPRVQILRHWRLVTLADLQRGDHIILKRTGPP